MQILESSFILLVNTYVQIADWDPNGIDMDTAILQFLKKLGHDMAGMKQLIN